MPINTQSLETLKGVISVLNKIDRRDFEIPKVNLVSDKLNHFGDLFSTYENNFVAKFNEVYALLEMMGNIPNRIELHRQLQLPKKYIYSDHNDPVVERYYHKLCKKFGEETNGKFEFEVIPDFFIHKDQRDERPENQQLIIEFKTQSVTPINRLMWDFFKLNLYLEKYHYQTACFVCTNNAGD